VRADDEPYVVEAEPSLAQRELELAHRARLMKPGVDEHDTRGRGDGERVHVRDAGPGERQPEPPQAGKDALGASELPSPCAHGSISTPGLRIPVGSTAAFAARSASANASGRWRSYQGRWSRPTA
jgi:hypothetical protein